MSYPQKCDGCRRGDHERHDPGHGIIKGVIGGSYCPCKGGCTPPELPAFLNPPSEPLVTDNALHVMPRGDLFEHTAAEDCSCGPTARFVQRSNGGNGWLYTHHSLDGREKTEQ